MEIRDIIKVGTNRLEYNQLRNIVDLPFDHHQVSRVKNYYSIPSYLSFKVRGKVNWIAENSFRDFGWNKVALVHLFNGIRFDHLPWLTTFETTLPRWGEISKQKTEEGLRRLAHASCKKMIGFSAQSEVIMRMYLRDQFPAFESELLPKLTHSLPAQKLLLSSIDDKITPDNFIMFGMTGTDFFRKGGREVLQVFEQLIKEKQPVKLIIISGLATGDYVTQSTPADANAARELISRYPDHITLHPHMPYHQVMEVIKKVDVGLLPSWHETFGYTVLEFQSVGCPVITTDVRAMPEINNDDCGWVIPVPQDEWKNAYWRTEEARSKMSSIIREGLYKSISEMLNDSKVVRSKGALALERIRTQHDPKQKANFLEAIYDEALR